MSDRMPPTTPETPREPVRVQMPVKKPVVTYTIITITVIVFALQLLTLALEGNELSQNIGGDMLSNIGVKDNDAIMMGQFWRLFTPALLHGSILHIVFNMYALYVIGSGLERFYGHGRFFLLYVLSAFAGNVLSFVLNPARSLGASTAVFGVFAAQGMFIYQNRKLFGETRTRQAIMNLGLILMINLGIGFMPGVNIDNMGHIGGLLGGTFFAWKAGPALKLTGQPPYLSIKDARRKSDILIASMVVMIGFMVIALIPFYRA